MRVDYVPIHADMYDETTELTSRRIAAHRHYAHDQGHHRDGELRRAGGTALVEAIDTPSDHLHELKKFIEFN